MALTVVTGPANAGKTRVLHGAIEESLEAGKIPALLVPSVPDKQRFIDEFAGKSVCGLKVEVFDRWLGEQWALHGDGRLPVGEFARRVLVTRAVAAAKLCETADSARYTGFRDLVAQLARSGLSSAGDSSVPTKADLEIAGILSIYEGLLEDRGLIELAQAARVLAAEPPPLPGPVIVNRFNDLSAAQEELLLGLSRCNEVFVALTWEKDHPATEAATPLVERLVCCSRHVVVKLARQPHTELERIERALFRPTEAIEAGGALAIVGAPDVEAEFSAITRVVAELLESGTAPHEIAVVFRQPARRLHLFERLGRELEIPVSVDVAVPFAQTPYGSALLALFHVASGRNRDRSRLLTFMTSPYSGLGTAAVGVVADRWERVRVEGLQLLDEGERLGGAAGAAVAAARVLTRQSVGRASSDKWQELADQLLACARQARPPGTPGAVLDVAAHAVVCSLLSSAIDVEDDHPTCEELLDALGTARVSSAVREAHDAVVITEVHRLQSRRFEAVIIGGLSGGEFSPQRPDSLAREIAVRLGAQSVPDEHAAERLRFYSAFTRARHHVVLTHPVGGPAAQSERVSPFIEEVLDLYRSEVERATGEGPRQRGVRGDGDPFIAWEHAGVAGKGPLRRPTRGILTDPASLTLIAEREEHSISEIETYIACPYRWFMHYVVRARSRSGQLGPAELGSLGHRVLATFYRRWAEQGDRQRVLPGDEERADLVLSSTWEECQGGMVARTLEERHARARVRDRVRAIIADDATLLPSFEPCEHEYAFGAAAGRPFSFAGGHVSGSIDRIDQGPAGLVVSDYKSGSDIKGHAQWSDAGLLQLPIYAAAARHFFGEPVVGAVYRSLATLRVRGVWIEAATQLCSRGSKSDAADEAGIEATIADAESRVAAALDGMRAGRIPAIPAREASCAHCRVASVCTRVEVTWSFS